MRNAVVVVFAAAVVIAAGIVEGMRSNRWGATDDLLAAAGKLDRVPRQFGNWVSTESPLDEKVVRVTEAVGNISRIYTNSKNGNRVSVLLLCGKAGPIGAHTPQICYGGLGYSLKGTETRKGYALANGSGVSLWMARFEKASPTDSPLRVYWGWSTNGDWEASANPRTDFALHSALYKIYMVQSDNPADLRREQTQAQAEENGPVEQFLTEFLPLVKTALAVEPG